MDDKTAKKKKRRTIGLIILAIALIVAVGLTASCVAQVREAQKNQSLRNVKTSEVKKGTIQQTVTGSGQLEAADSTEVRVPAGIRVKTVEVESGDAVSAGDTLATLETDSITDSLVQIEKSIRSIDDELAADKKRGSEDEDKLTDLEKEQLDNQKKSLEESQDELNSLKKDPSVRAPEAGTIGTVNVTEGSETAAGSAVSSSSAGAYSFGSGSTDISSISDMAGTGTLSSAVIEETSSAETADEQHIETVPSSASLLSEEVSVTPVTSDSAADSSDAANQVITDFSSLLSKLKTPAVGDAPQTSADLFTADSSDTDGSEFLDTNHYTGSIQWTPEDSEFQDKKTYTAVLTLQAQDGWSFRAGAKLELEAGQCSITVSDDARTMTIQITYPETAISGGSQNTGGQNSSGISGLNGIDVSGLSGDSGASYDSSAISGLGETDGSLSADSVLGGSSEGATYSGSDCTAFTILKNDRAEVDVSIDEQDILSISEGQDVTVILDAMPDQEFEGKVTKIASTATEGSGSAKYAVTVELDKTEEMKYGMTAQAVIRVGTAQDVLTIPMEALQQEGHRLFVYTTEDDKGNLGGEKDVETGLSDGENLEIRSGLKEGDTVYYLSTESDTANTGMFSVTEEDDEGDGENGGGTENSAADDGGTQTAE